MFDKTRIVRSPFLPPDQMYILKMPDGDEQVIVLPSTVSDEAFAKAEAMVENHNKFVQDFNFMMKFFEKPDEPPSPPIDPHPSW